ncbi:MAG: hypothetical protein AAF483_28475 [Planctomycetota bacterium]
MDTPSKRIRFGIRSIFVIFTVLAVALQTIVCFVRGSSEAFASHLLLLYFAAGFCILTPAIYVYLLGQRAALLCTISTLLVWTLILVWIAEMELEFRTFMGGHLFVSILCSLWGHFYLLSPREPNCTPLAGNEEEATWREETLAVLRRTKRAVVQKRSHSPSRKLD